MSQPTDAALRLLRWYYAPVRALQARATRSGGIPQGFALPRPRIQGLTLPVATVPVDPGVTVHAVNRQTPSRARRACWQVRAVVATSALFVLTVLLTPVHTAAAQASWVDGCSIPGLDKICKAAGAIGSATPTPGSIAGDAANGFFAQLNQWVAAGAAWVLDHVIQAVRSGAAVNIDATWFSNHYGVMIGLSAAVMVPILVIVAMKCAFTGEGGPFILATLLYLPFTIVLIFISLHVVNLMVGSVDWMSNVIGQELNVDYDKFATNVAQGLGGGDGSTPNAAAPFVQLIGSIFIVIFGLLTLVELLFRNGSLYITAFFIPFALAPLVLPGMAGMAKKLFNTLIALIFIKFFIVASLAIGVAALGVQMAMFLGGFAAVLSGVVILILAAVLPNLLIGILPLIEGAAMATIAARSSVQQVAMPASTRVYANIRRDNEARLMSGNVGANVGRGAATSRMLNQAANTSAARGAMPGATSPLAPGPSGRPRPGGIGPSTVLPGRRGMSTTQPTSMFLGKQQRPIPGASPVAPTIPGAAAVGGRLSPPLKSPRKPR